MNSNNTCISGHCNRFGTLDRTPKGECICQIGFVGDRCEYCDKGYVSSLPVDHESVCDICQIGYHKDGNTCQEGKCDQERTEQVDPTGRCHCKVGYSGAQCNECAQGHSGDDCDHCNSGFVMDKRGICHGILAYILILHFLVLFNLFQREIAIPLVPKMLQPMAVVSVTLHLKVHIVTNASLATLDLNVINVMNTFSLWMGNAKGAT